jgi:hypothetical protein
MELRTGKYANLLLTVIAVLLAALVFQTSVGLVSTAHAQRLGELPDTGRDYQADTGRNFEQARAQTQQNVTSDPAVASGLQSIASAIRDLAEATGDVARSNREFAGAVRALEINITN